MATFWHEQLEGEGWNLRRWEDAGRTRFCWGELEVHFWTCYGGDVKEMMSNINVDFRGEV